MSTGAVFFAHKKRITERNSHLAGEASGSSNSNGCQAKTERRRQLPGEETGRGGTKLHASVAGSRVTEFIATAAPWEPYFTDNLVHSTTNTICEAKWCMGEFQSLHPYKLSYLMNTSMNLYI
jgi:hypothetical protein